MLSFVAVIAFVAVVLTSNVNVAYNSYAYVSTSQSIAPYEHFAINVDKYVRKFVSTSGAAEFERDSRALFLTNTVDMVNMGINYYVDYLSIQGGLTKAEQSTLNKSYKAYEDAFSNTRKIYNEYISELSDIYGDDGPSHQWEDVEQFNIDTKEEDLVRSYYATYLKGSEFFRVIQSNVRSHALTEDMTLSEILLSLRVYYADRALQDIFVNGLTVKLDMNDEDNCPSVKDYVKVLTYDAYTDADLLIITSLKNFVDEASSVDLYRLVNDYTSYLDTLSTENRARAIRAKSFIDSNILV